MKIQNILVPTDFSDDASVALDYAIELAGEFGARLHLLHAYRPMIATGAPYGVSVPLDVTESIREAAGEALAEWMARVDKAGIEAETHLEADTPSSAIRAAAKSHDIDLIVMGTRGRTGLRHVLLGSVAERTVRTAPCPVLTLKADE